MKPLTLQRCGTYDNLSIGGFVGIELCQPDPQWIHVIHVPTLPAAWEWAWANPKKQ